MIILGIDPGLASTGFGAIICDKNTPSLLTCGHIRTSTGQHIARRLFHIHSDMQNLISSIHPDLVAIENAFSIIRYPKAGIILGGVLGIIYLSVSQYNISMVEITPKEVKNSLAGYGGAEKYQIKKSVKKLLNIKNIKSIHACDALAVALTAFYRKSYIKDDILS